MKKLQYEQNNDRRYLPPENVAACSEESLYCRRKFMDKIYVYDTVDKNQREYCRSKCKTDMSPNVASAISGFAENESADSYREYGYDHRENQKFIQDEQAFSF